MINEFIKITIYQYHKLTSQGINTIIAIKKITLKEVRKRQIIIIAGNFGYKIIDPFRVNFANI